MTPQEKQERQRVLESAHSFLRTPYHHQGRVKGAGVDCATFICMAFEETGLESPIDLPAYSKDWFIHQADELYLTRVLKRTTEISEQQALPGDIVLYKLGRIWAHGGIIIEPGWPMIIHAYHRARYVITTEGNQGDFEYRPRRFFRRNGWVGNSA
jgi:cell wall-associated NlpC family hydrolase